MWLLAAALAGFPVLATAAPVGLSAGAAVAGVAQPAAGPVSVTLITGDRVRLGADRQLLDIRPGPGRRSVSFVTARQGGQLTVTPSDAAPLIRRGVVDARLFNISMLVDYGYDDARRTTVPTMARGLAAASGSGAAGTSRLKTLGMGSPREVRAVRAYAGGVDKRRAHEFWNEVKNVAAGVQQRSAAGPRIWLDGKRFPLLDQAVQQIGASTAWAAGLTGRGVTVAVLDTGLDATHPDFAGRVVASANFTTESDADVVGHGTHVASIVLGSGAASGGQYRGVAYEASLAVGKVCLSYGCMESDMLNGMQWAASTQHARVINMSIGGTGSPDIDPLEEAVDNLSASTGALFVISAGNAGCAKASTIASPSTAKAALSVGAVDRADKIASFSSCGPRQGDYGVKPEITAPGVGIVAARSATASADMPPQGPGGNYTTLSGTSMASPMVAGAAAIVAQKHPDWTGEQIKAALVGSALPAAGVGAFVQGAGRVDVPAALNQVIVGVPAGAAFGVQLWPHGDDSLLRQTLTFRNTGSQPEVLSLSVQAFATGGSVAPPGMFSLSSQQLSVPAGGSASVDLVANTVVDAPDEAFAGQVVASSATGNTRVLFSVYKEPESYNLTIKQTDRAGQPAFGFTTELLGLDLPVYAYIYGTPGERLGLRLRQGRYMLVTTFSGATASDVVVAPDVMLDRDRVVNMDARHTAEWRTRVPDTAAVPLLRQISATRWNVPMGESSLSFYTFDPASQLRFGSTDPRRRPADFAFNLFTNHGHPDQYGSPDGKYPLTSTFDRLSSVPHGRVKSYAPSELAEVTVKMRAASTGIFADATMRPESPGSLNLITQGFVSVDEQPLTFFLTRGPTMGWALDNFVQPDVPNAFLENFLLLRKPPRHFTPGQRYEIDRASVAPFSPTLNASWGGFRISPLPGQVYGDPASKLAPMLRRPSTDPAVDLMLLNFSEYGTPDGSGGGLLMAPGVYKHVTLSRDGVLEASADMGNSTLVMLPVAAVDGRYTLREEVPEAGLLGLALGLPSSSVTEWTFRSARGVPQQWQTLPVSIIRVGMPTVQRDGATPTALRFVLTVQRQQAVAAVPDEVRSLTAKVSYNAGGTWLPALVSRGSGGEWTVTAARPQPGKAVSLRARAVSADGSTVQQTLVDLFPATTVR